MLHWLKKSWEDRRTVKWMLTVSSDYHIPVLLQESVSVLVTNEDGVYVDVTFGGGGHSKKILKRLSKMGRLYGFDQDKDAIRNVLDDDRFFLAPSNFRHLRRWLRYCGEETINGVLADLGVSSFQFDEIERGFSYRGDALLDMRMNRESELDARVILNTYSDEELQEMLSKYGEVRNAKTLAREITERRRASQIETVSDFLTILEKVARGNRMRYYSQVFQAIRIEVNDELGALKGLLESSSELIQIGGRLVVIAYHSIEDRMVKNYLKTGNVEGELQKDVKGNVIKPFQEMRGSPVQPSESEVKLNKRARSAIMRIGVRV